MTTIVSFGDEHITRIGEGQYELPYNGEDDYRGRR